MAKAKKRHCETCGFQRHGALQTKRGRFFCDQCAIKHIDELQSLLDKARKEIENPDMRTMKKCPDCDKKLWPIAHSDDKYGCPDCARNWILVDCKEAAALHDIQADIEQIRSVEANCVTILCDNPDAVLDEKQVAVEVCGDFTEYQTVRYFASTWTEALRKAADASRQFNEKGS